MPQTVEKAVFLIVVDFLFFVFLATGAAEKLLIGENRLFSGFQGYVGGIGGSGVQSEILRFSANGIPAKRVPTLSTLSGTLRVPQKLFILLPIHSKGNGKLCFLYPQG